MFVDGSEDCVFKSKNVGDWWTANTAGKSTVTSPVWETPANRENEHSKHSSLGSELVSQIKSTRLDSQPAASFQQLPAPPPPLCCCMLRPLKGRLITVVVVVIDAPQSANQPHWLAAQQSVAFERSAAVQDHAEVVNSRFLYVIRRRISPHS